MQLLFCMMTTAFAGSKTALNPGSTVYMCKGAEFCITRQNDDGSVELKVSSGSPLKISGSETVYYNKAPLTLTMPSIDDLEVIGPKRGHYEPEEIPVIKRGDVEYEADSYVPVKFTANNRIGKLKPDCTFIKDTPTYVVPYEDMPVILNGEELDLEREFAVEIPKYSLKVKSNDTLCLDSEKALGVCNFLVYADKTAPSEVFSFYTENIVDVKEKYEQDVKTLTLLDEQDAEPEDEGKEKKEIVLSPELQKEVDLAKAQIKEQGDVEDKESQYDSEDSVLSSIPSDGSFAELEDFTDEPVESTEYETESEEESEIVLRRGSIRKHSIRRGSLASRSTISTVSKDQSVATIESKVSAKTSQVSDEEEIEAQKKEKFEPFGESKFYRDIGFQDSGAGLERFIEEPLIVPTTKTYRKKKPTKPVAKRFWDTSKIILGVSIVALCLVLFVIVFVLIKKLRLKKSKRHGK